MDKKWLIGVVTAIIIVPAITLQWKNIQSIWAAPSAIATVEKKVEHQETSDAKQQETLDTLKNMVYEQKIQSDAQKKIDAAQLEALKAIVEASKKK